MSYPMVKAQVYSASTNFEFFGRSIELIAMIHNLKVPCVVFKCYLNGGDNRLFINIANFRDVVLNSPVGRDSTLSRLPDWDARKYTLIKYTEGGRWDGDIVFTFKLRRIPRKWIPEYDMMLAGIDPNKIDENIFP